MFGIIATDDVYVEFSNYLSIIFYPSICMFGQLMLLSFQRGFPVAAGGARQKLLDGLSWHAADKG